MGSSVQQNKAAAQEANATNVLAALLEY